jgi:Family of unknown function (DUF5906)
LLLHADEGFWAGDHAAEGKLKDLITGETQWIEFKGKDLIRVRNYIRLFVTGNSEWLVPAGYGERRFAIFDMGSTKRIMLNSPPSITRWTMGVARRCCIIYSISISRRSTCGPSRRLRPYSSSRYHP